MRCEAGRVHPRPGRGPLPTVRADAHRPPRSVFRFEGRHPAGAVEPRRSAQARAAQHPRRAGSRVGPRCSTSNTDSPTGSLTHHRSRRLRVTNRRRCYCSSCRCAGGAARPRVVGRVQRGLQQDGGRRVIAAAGANRGTHAAPGERSSVLAVGITLGINHGEPVLPESTRVLVGDTPARSCPLLSAGRCCLRIRRLGVRIPPSAPPKPRQNPI